MFKVQGGKLLAIGCISRDALLATSWSIGQAMSSRSVLPFTLKGADVQMTSDVATVLET
jgi:hypothetical protein